jgi:hypothetical protein
MLYQVVALPTAVSHPGTLYVSELVQKRLKLVGQNFKNLQIPPSAKIFGFLNNRI